MVAIEREFPCAEVEHAVVISVGGATPELADALVRLAGAIRGLTGTGLKEAASTRALIATARLVKGALSPVEAPVAAIALPLSDDPAMSTGTVDIFEQHFGRTVRGRPPPPDTASSLSPGPPTPP